MTQITPIKECLGRRPVSYDHYPPTLFFTIEINLNNLRNLRIFREMKMRIETSDMKNLLSLRNLENLLLSHREVDHLYYMNNHQSEH